jgi:hypothetical protein
MALAAGSVHVRATDVADVVKEKGKPQPRVEWGPKQPRPCDGDHNGMEEKLMSAEQNALRADCHDCLVESTASAGVAGRADAGMLLVLGDDHRSRMKATISGVVRVRAATRRS